MKIQFEAGISRHGNAPVNYLIGIDQECPDTTLYAEITVPEGASEDYGYLALKAEVQKQAAAAGIADLEFWYDNQEQYLAPDAAAQGEIRYW